ncbi:Uncharacterized protein PBTT_01470 [Plasmodiophora brassicae]|uniref:Uncharacterized protein n=1 Tax=Plasmodiophora brassicae TaxID=37360 RepID=A0A0G4IIG8_PLABS|nr:hypothetical protein PBRA_003688 [Plasmodiophora brassicae]SPQ94207.1 unnamed protein product [Plasmodiophora brassicae]
MSVVVDDVALCSWRSQHLVRLSVAEGSGLSISIDDGPGRCLPISEIRLVPIGIITARRCMDTQTGLSSLVAVLRCSAPDATHHIVVVSVPDPLQDDVVAHVQHAFPDADKAARLTLADGPLLLAATGSTLVFIQRSDHGEYAALPVSLPSPATTTVPTGNGVEVATMCGRFVNVSGTPLALNSSTSIPSAFTAPATCMAHHGPSDTFVVGSGDAVVSLVRRGIIAHRRPSLPSAPSAIHTTLHHCVVSLSCRSAVVVCSIADLALVRIIENAAWAIPVSESLLATSSGQRVQLGGAECGDAPTRLGAVAIALRDRVTAGCAELERVEGIHQYKEHLLAHMERLLSGDGASVFPSSDVFGMSVPRLVPVLERSPEKAPESATAGVKGVSIPLFPVSSVRTARDGADFHCEVDVRIKDRSDEVADVCLIVLGDDGIVVSSVSPTADTSRSGDTLSLHAVVRLDDLPDYVGSTKASLAVSWRGCQAPLFIDTVSIDRWATPSDIRHRHSRSKSPVAAPQYGVVASFCLKCPDVSQVLSPPVGMTRFEDARTVGRHPKLVGSEQASWRSMDDLVEMLVTCCGADAQVVVQGHSRARVADCTNALLQAVDGPVDLSPDWTILLPLVGQFVAALGDEISIAADLVTGEVQTLMEQGGIHASSADIRKAITRYTLRSRKLADAQIMTDNLAGRILTYFTEAQRDERLPV